MTLTILGFFGSGLVSRMWMREERRPGTTRYRRSTWGCGIFPEVHAGPGQVRIRVHAATVNPTDVGVRDGSRAEQQKADPPPYVPGMEAAGIVDEVGSGVPDRLKIGDAVMAIVVPKGSHGAYREQIVLDARSVVRAPAGKTHTEACTLPMNGLTARQTLDLLKLSPGQVITVTGAAGAYGGYV